MHLPLISVVLCSYNGAAFIEEQIESLLKQTYPNLEIVISDDASTDGTQHILEKYRTHSAIKLFFQQYNLGPIKNVAFAIQQTTGAFIAFCDQDDIWLPYKVQTLFSYIDEHILVYSDSELIDEQGQKLHKKLSQLRRMYSGTATKGFVFSNVVWGHTMLISRWLVPYILPIPDAIPHDIWMAFKAATIKGIKYIDVPLTRYRQHAHSVTKTIAAKPQSRTSAKRYTDFKGTLHWIYIMQQHARREERPFYNRLYTLYAGKERGGFQWALLFFLLRHLKSLYLFSRKKRVSQIVDVIKHARGVRL